MIQEDFALFANRFKEAMLLLQDNGTIISSNPPAQRLFNKTDAQLVNTNLSEYTSDPIEKLNRYLLLWKSSGEYLPGRFTLIDAPNDNIDITIEGCLLKPRTHKGPALLMLRCFAKSKSIKSFSILNEKIQQLTKEIHERAAIEKGLRESEEKVRLLLQSTAEAIYGVNNMGFCTFANQALLDMLNLESESLLVGKQIHSLLHHTDIHGNKIPESQSPIYKAYKGKQDVYVEESVIWKPEGGSIHIEYWAQPIIQDDVTLGAVITIIDITERLQIKNAMRTLASGTSSAMGNKFYEDIVTALVNLLEVSTAFIGLINPEDPNIVNTVAFWQDGNIQENTSFALEQTPCNNLLQGNQLSIPHNLQAKFPDSALLERHNFESYFGSPLLASDGSVLGMVTLLHTKPMDIDERTESLLQVFAKRIAMELEQQKTTLALQEHQEHLESLVQQRTNELEQAYRDLESYSYSIAHDLRAPLRSITSFSEILREDLKDRLDTTEADFMNRIVKSSKFMAELISDILELSRISRIEINHSELNLSDLIKTIIQDKIQHFPDRKFNISIQDNVYINSDPKLLYLMVQNLIENAIKFSQHKPETFIEFACESNDKNELICHIKDNGAGFNSEYKEKLFTPFQRLHKREEFEGTGIGLATVKRILERIKGDIWVEAEVDKGACFYFKCPSLHIRTIN